MAYETHVFSSIWLHFNWHCKFDRPQITPRMEPVLWKYLTAYTKSLANAWFDAINGTDTHIHLLVRLGPMWSPGKFIGMLKGASARKMNKQFGAAALAWQRGYGVVSFAESNLPALRAYVKNQKKHHRAGEGLRSMLEDTGGNDGAEDSPKSG